jgi:hypothetical protein
MPIPELLSDATIRGIAETHTAQRLRFGCRTGCAVVESARPSSHRFVRGFGC